MENHSSAVKLTNILSLLRSLFVTDPLIFLYTAVCGAASLTGSLFDSNGRWQHGCARAWSRLILTTSRVRIELEGLGNIPKGETVIFCANHPSAMDIPILFTSLPLQFRFVAKRSLFNVPFLGWHLWRSGHIPVERERPRKAMKSLESAAERVRSGSPVVLFPEGHRSREGGMGAFKSGSFYLAVKARTPVVPITISGSREVLAPDSLHVRPGKVKVVIHPAIPTTAFRLEDVAKLGDQVRQIVLSRFEG